VANPQKAKGDRSEIEAAALLTDLLGYPVRRKLGAGRLDDTGDLDGLPGLVVQVANWADVRAAVRAKPLGAEVQRQHAGATFGVAMVRFRGGQWRMVMLPEQFAALYREALA
jgi:hypothetical protein